MPAVQFCNDRERDDDSPPKGFDKRSKMRKGGEEDVNVEKEDGIIGIMER